MILSDKRIAQLVKKLSGKAPSKRKAITNVDETVNDTEIKSASADEIFQEMKKLPYSG
jgi:phosphoribosyl 1,2-cyclic phosphodiesterase